MSRLNTRLAKLEGVITAERFYTVAVNTQDEIEPLLAKYGIVTGPKDIVCTIPAGPLGTRMIFADGKHYTYGHALEHKLHPGDKPFDPLPPEV